MNTEPILDNLFLIINSDFLMQVLLKQQGWEEMDSYKEVMLLMMLKGKEKHQSHSKKYQGRPGFQIKFAHCNLVHSNHAPIFLAQTDLAPEISPR